MQADGAKQHRLVASDTRIDDPAWSPDSTRIAYSQSNDSTASSDLVIVTADGADRTLVLADRGFYGQPSWSPDGKSLAFRIAKGGSAQIGTVRLSDWAT
jgi:TolB protein